jgi:hypothetical protein
MEVKDTKKKDSEDVLSVGPDFSIQNLLLGPFQHYDDSRPVIRCVLTLQTILPFSFLFHKITRRKGRKESERLCGHRVGTGDTKKDGTVANNMVIMLHCVSRRKSCSYDRSRILQTTIFIVFQNVVRIRPQDQSTSTTCWVKRKEIQECRPLGTRHLLFPSSFSPHVGRYDTAFIVFYLPSVSLAVERATLR